MTTPPLAGLDHAAESAMTMAARATATAPIGTIQTPGGRPFSNTRTNADWPLGDLLSIMEHMEQISLVSASFTIR